MGNASRTGDYTPISDPPLGADDPGYGEPRKQSKEYDGVYARLISTERWMSGGDQFSRMSKESDPGSLPNTGAVRVFLADELCERAKDYRDRVNEAGGKKALSEATMTSHVNVLACVYGFGATVFLCREPLPNNRRTLVYIVKGVSLDLKILSLLRKLQIEDQVTVTYDPRTGRIAEIGKSA